MPTLHSLLGTCCWLSYPSWYGKECKVGEVWPLVLFYFFLQHDSCSSEPYRALQHVHNHTYPIQSLQHLQHCWSFTLIPDGPLLFCLVSCLLDVKQQTNEWMRCLHVCIMWRTLEYLMCLIMFTLNRTSFRSGKWKKKIFSLYRILSWSGWDQSIPVLVAVWHLKASQSSRGCGLVFFTQTQSR